MSTTNCARCNRSVSDGPLFRVNPLGENGVFVCIACMSVEELDKLDPETVRLVTIIAKEEK